MGISVPPGFILPIELQKGEPEKVWQAVKEGIKGLEALTGQRFGDAQNPLLLSVRSGAPVSMPGMMDTFLNIGMNPCTLSALQEKLSPPVVEEMVQEFIKNYGLRVWGIPLVGESSDDLKQDFFNRTQTPWQEDIEDHLWNSIQAVWHSWDSPRARYYREQNEIAHIGGSAVIIQAMVFGNGASPSGTGVFFTRDPITGEKGLFGEYLVSAQGESLVSGSVTPLALDHLNDLWPHLYQELEDYQDSAKKTLLSHLAESLQKDCTSLDIKDHYWGIWEESFLQSPLQLWSDKNHNGVVDQNEKISLADSGIFAFKVCSDKIDNNISVVAPIELTHKTLAFKGSASLIKNWLKNRWAQRFDDAKSWLSNPSQWTKWGAIQTIPFLELQTYFTPGHHLFRDRVTKLDQQQISQINIGSLLSSSSRLYNFLDHAPYTLPSGPTTIERIIIPAGPPQISIPTKRRCFVYNVGEQWTHIAQSSKIFSCSHNLAVVRNIPVTIYTETTLECQNDGHLKTIAGPNQIPRKIAEDQVCNGTYKIPQNCGRTDGKTQWDHVWKKSGGCTSTQLAPRPIIYEKKTYRCDVNTGEIIEVPTQGPTTYEAAPPTSCEGLERG